jgi:hypothetical protein
MKSLVWSGIAAAGLTGLALAAAPAFHDMTLDIPGGGIAHIRYIGDTPPKVNFVRSETALAPAAFGPSASPFAELDRISALMDAQMAEMMLHARMMQQAAMQQVPFGASGEGGLIQAGSGQGFCMHSVQITSDGRSAPKVVSQTSGNCGAEAKPAAPAAAAGQSAPDPLQAISYRPAPPSSHRQGV